MGVTVESLWKYPVTGGPGISLESAGITSGGIIGDRNFIVAEQREDGYRRLGSKQAPDLLALTFTNDGQTAHLDGYPLKLPFIEFGSDKPADTACDEFGDATPVWFTSPDHDAAFSDYLHRPVRFLQKTTAWLEGESVPRHRRAVAPLHIIGTASVAQIIERSGSQQADVRRFRPNIVLAGLEPDAELELIGSTIRLGGVATGVTLQIDRVTPRCVVTSFDPQNGEDKGDISLRTMARSMTGEGKSARCAGVYAHLVDAHDTLKVGDKLIGTWT